METKEQHKAACGYEIVKAFVDDRPRHHVICRHPDGTFCVGVNYDKTSRTWGFGHYGYPTIEDAAEYLKWHRLAQEVDISEVVA